MGDTAAATTCLGGSMTSNNSHHGQRQSNADLDTDADRAAGSGPATTTLGTMEDCLRELYDIKYLWSDKWGPAIVAALWDGPLRYNDILEKVRSYSIAAGWTDKTPVLHESILTRTLKRMVGEGLITRSESSGGVPPSVWYALNPSFAESYEVGLPLVDWARRNSDLIARAKAHRRHHGGTAA
ncbi:winged helix-turn-helix transcriptional regulator [Haloechinothrix halophila]|uniref:winged helix-turn-helix transcriptional regulator n=1 Tax=Haloechinothrix halophila TaxID=1069073 RepID=UPI00041532C8|nr:winged helix-turn-helix transcriptional regulator [Haloechinothrix halophila]